jgi:hypothetical protein
MSNPRSGPSDRANYFRLLAIIYRLELLEKGELYYRFDRRIFDLEDEK